MNFEQLRTHLQSRAIQIKAADGKLSVRAEKGAVDLETRALLTQYKADLLDLLAREPLALSWDEPASGLEQRLTPDMLSLVQLTQEEIDLIVDGTPGGVAAIQDIYPLSPLQEGFLFHHLLQTEGDVYLERAVIGFRDQSRLDGFLDALQQVINRHDILRSGARWKGLTRQVQVVQRQATLPRQHLVLDSGDDALASLLAQTDPRKVRLDLQGAPLLAAHFGQDPVSGEWLLALLHHHMVCDHVTLEFIVGEIHLILSGQAGKLPQALPYRNFIAQTLAVPASEHEGYFKRRLADIDETTAPFAVLNVMGEGGEVQEGHLSLDAALAQRLRTLAARHGVTTAVLFHAAWARVVALCSGRQDVVFGTVLSGRLQGSEAAGRVLGLFINALPIRVSLGQRTVAQLLADTYADLTELLQHEQASLTMAQQCSGVHAPAPLFTSLLNYRHSHAKIDGKNSNELMWDGMRLIAVGERTNYPVTMSIDDTGDGFELEAQCVQGISPQRMVQYLATALASLVSALEHNPALGVSELAVLPPDELTHLVHTLNHTAAAPALAASLPHMLARRVQASPDAVALVDQERPVSYAELDTLSTRVARHLQQQGVAAPQRVGVFAERGLEMVVALLAILKTGAAYLPLDSNHPPERLAHIISDAAPGVILLQVALQTSLAAALDGASHQPQLLLLDEQAALAGVTATPAPDQPWQPLESTPEQIAYVIYTSGSTGLPKGVANSARGLINRLQWFARTVALQTPVTAMRTSISFVDSITEVLDTLLAGGTLVVFDKMTLLDHQLFARRAAEYRITNLMVVPALLNHLLEVAPAALASLQTVITSGERLPPELLQRLAQSFPAIRLFNTYGCSEVNGDATACECRPGSDGVARSVIGRPIDHATVYILDSQRQLVPQGAVGEIYIGGAGVAEGYINRAELSVDRFVPDLFGDNRNARLYKTGDLGRLLPDGNIEYLGRNDFQVKMRGFRIEPGEIEATLKTHPRVKDCVVMAREERQGDPRLAAYLVARDSARPADNAQNAVTEAGDAGFSLFYFGATSGEEQHKYRLYLEAAKYADQNGFEAIWTPERHFDEVAGLYPNPSILSAAIATITSRVHLRAGSVVLPLQHPVRVAEEWSVLDNLSGGRVGVAIASGWHMRDFVLAPENHAKRHKVMYEGIRTLNSLWQGEEVTFRDGADRQSPIRIYPKPLQAQLPMWLTSAGANETFIEAGRLGLNLLTHLLGQTVDEVAGKIALYRESLARHGFDPDSRKVTLMIHTFLDADYDTAINKAREPFKRYMRAHVGLIKSLTDSLQHAVDNVDPENIESVVSYAFDRYSKSAAFIGTPQSCLPIYQQLREAGVTEFACLFDWMETDDALAGLPHLASFMQLARASVPATAQLRQHLLARLPEYMLPASYTWLEQLPLTASGKVNRLALPVPGQVQVEEATFDAPQGVEEISIARLWQDMLNIERVDRNGNFFTLGGHSLLAVQMISTVGKLFGTEMPLRQLFANPTVARFAEAIRQQSSTNQHPNLVTIRKRGSQRPLFLIHPGEGEIGYARDIAPWISSDIPVYGFAASGLLSGETPQTTIEDIAARYVRSMRHVQPQGPYRIAGWSAGGTIGYEMARQLQAADQVVEFMGMIDTDFSYLDLFALSEDDLDDLDKALAFDEIKSLLAYLPYRAPEDVSNEVKLLAQARDFDAMLERMHRHNFIPKGVDGSILQRHLALRHTLAVALYHYVTPQLPLNVTLFSASGESRLDPSIGWRGHLPANLLTLVPVSGTHYSIVEEPNVRDLGRELSNAIKNAASRPASVAEPYQPRVVIQSGQPDVPPLFCVPGAGASVASFHDLSQAMPESLPIIGLQARGLDGMQVPHPDIPSAARACVAAVREVQPQGPYHLLGHSFGGWIAFEMALQLVASGERVAQLCLVDSRVPSAAGAGTQRISRLDTLQQLIDLYNLRLSEPLKLGASQLRRLSPDQQLARLHEALVQAGLMSARGTFEVLRGVVQVLEANLATTWRPQQAFEGAVQVINARQTAAPAGQDNDRLNGWREFAPHLQCSEVDGNHLTMLLPPQVQALAGCVMQQRSAVAAADEAVSGN